MRGTKVLGDNALPAWPWRLPLRLWRELRANRWDVFPILTYHRIVPTSERPAVWGDESVKKFAWQMQWLARGGYRGVSLGEAWTARDQESGRGAEGLVALTFDDGSAETLTLAAPILAGHGFTATVFVCTGRMHRSAGSVQVEPLDGNSSRPLDWAELRQLLDLGFEIGSHTRTHPRLISLLAEDEQKAWEEIAGSRLDIELQLGVSARFFAYPYGEENPQLRNLARRAGYEAAVGITVPDGSIRRFALHRRDFSVQERLDGRSVRRLVRFSLAFPGPLVGAVSRNGHSLGLCGRRRPWFSAYLGRRMGTRKPRVPAR